VTNPVNYIIFDGYFIRLLSDFTILPKQNVCIVVRIVWEAMQTQPIKAIEFEYSQMNKGVSCYF